MGIAVKNIVGAWLWTEGVTTQRRGTILGY